LKRIVDDLSVAGEEGSRGNKRGQVPETGQNNCESLGGHQTPHRRSSRRWPQANPIMPSEKMGATNVPHGDHDLEERPTTDARHDGETFEGGLLEGLPVTAGRFLPKHLHPHRPPGASIDYFH
ncbi:unnamed protein product, partial [Ectocarpus sp. 4 AP-2014]